MVRKQIKAVKQKTDNMYKDAGFICCSEEGRGLYEEKGQSPSRGC